MSLRYDVHKALSHPGPNAPQALSCDSAESYPIHASAMRFILQGTPWANPADHLPSPRIVTVQMKPIQCGECRTGAARVNSAKSVRHWVLEGAGRGEPTIDSAGEGRGCFSTGNSTLV